MKQKITLSLPKSIENAVKDENFRVFYNESADEIELFLYGIVGDEWTESDAGSIAKILASNRDKPVTMRINSFGGLAYDGLAIHNAIADHKGQTTAIIESVAASAASLAAIGADRVKMYANATYQIHEGIGFAYGHIAEIRETLDWLEHFNDAAAKTYAAKTGKSEKEMAKALLGANGDGTKYNATQALEMGFIDEIVTAGSGKKTAAKNDTKQLQSMLNYRIAKTQLAMRAPMPKANTVDIFSKEPFANTEDPKRHRDSEGNCIGGTSHDLRTYLNQLLAKSGLTSRQ